MICATNIAVCILYLKSSDQVKDAVAMCEFFAWLEDEVSTGEVTEYVAALKIEDFRRQIIHFIVT